MNRILYVPALQGEFGGRLYYVALMRLSDIRERGGYAMEVNDNGKPNESMQRLLEDAESARRDRVSDMSRYLRDFSDRFFNSLVVSIHGGEPQWHPFRVEPSDPGFDEAAMREANREVIGFLELAGTERLFALDGQQGLAGLKDAVAREPSLGSDRLPVIFVAHSTTTPPVTPCEPLSDRGR